MEITVDSEGKVFLPSRIMARCSTRAAGEGGRGGGFLKYSGSDSRPSSHPGQPAQRSLSSSPFRMDSEASPFENLIALNEARTVRLSWFCPALPGTSKLFRSQGSFESLRSQRVEVLLFENSSVRLQGRTSLRRLWEMEPRQVHGTPCPHHAPPCP